MTVPETSCFGDAKFFPPGFRFHPTDEELILYYLKRKICRRRLKLDIIGETDVYKWDPEDLPGLSKLKTGDRQWFFFSPRDRKYPNGARSNRATMHGYWKATGKDRTISCNSRSVGVKKTLVYYKGRAPSGERTDWVMHEYTLDEEELKRCLSAKDYYALYKVYKKSGPGPKNGEQYGAPFVEEDWADDECVNFNANQMNSLKEADVSCVENNRANGQPQCLLNDLEELLNKIADEPVLASPLDVDYTHALNQLIGVEENTSSLVDNSLREIHLPEGNMVLHQSQQHNVQASFDYTHSATSQLQLYEASEVTSAPNICEQKLGENFLEDFLEMDDLIGPEPTVQNFGKQPEPLLFDEIDLLTDLDLFNDANMFLCDMVPGEQGQFSQPYVNNPGSGMVNVASNFLNIENGAVTHQMEPYRIDANLMSSQLWTEDERCYIFNPAEANQAAAVSQPISGVECNDNLGNVSTGGTQNQSGKVGTDSWFSSALWAFVESIPTTPASASESALVNRAFERMSSFGRVRINTGKTNDAAGNLGATSKRPGSFKGGLLCFSVLGIFCAILWVLIGTSIKLLGKYSSS